MGNKELNKIIEIRTAVGLLGEKASDVWWKSKWFDSNANTFLSPIFGKKVHLAIYQGILEAARKVHDEKIGLGKVYHLFRLPEELELRLHSLIIEENCPIIKNMMDEVVAMETLSKFSRNEVEKQIGPLWIGSPGELKNSRWLNKASSYYKKSFKDSFKTFPYFLEKN